MIDTHMHWWRPSVHVYPSLDEVRELNRDFGPEELGSAPSTVGVDGYVLVQAADAHWDTRNLLASADRDPRVRAVVGWVPLDRPDEAAATLSELGGHPAFRGVRALSHLYPDEGWLATDAVIESLSELSARGLTLDVIADRPGTRDAVLGILERAHGLTVVIDHLGSPSREHGYAGWEEFIRQVAERPNAIVKVSNISRSTVTRDEMSSAEMVALVWQVVGPDRMMLGSDWPVSTLVSDYPSTWNWLLSLIPADRQEAEWAAVTNGTAGRTYSF